MTFTQFQMRKVEKQLLIMYETLTKALNKKVDKNKQ